MFMIFLLSVLPIVFFLSLDIFNLTIDQNQYAELWRYRYYHSAPTHSYRLTELTQLSVTLILSLLITIIVIKRYGDKPYFAKLFMWNKLMFVALFIFALLLYKPIVTYVSSRGFPIFDYGCVIETSQTIIPVLNECGIKETVLYDGAVIVAISLFSSAFWISNVVLIAIKKQPNYVKNA